MGLPLLNVLTCSVASKKHREPPLESVHSSSLGMIALTGILNSFYNLHDIYFRKYGQCNENYKSCFALLFPLGPGTSKLSFALIQFHLNEFENMMLLILEQLLLNLFSINKVVLKKTFSISFLGRTQ